MAALALGGGWTALVLALVARRRPSPARVRALAPTAPPTQHRQQAPPLVERLGALVLTRGRRGRRRQAPPARARQVGSALLAALPFLVVLPVAAPGAALVAWSLPPLRLRRAERARREAIAAALPDVVDLLVLAVTAGLTVPLALRAVASRAGGPLGHELQRVLEDVAVGHRLADALDAMVAPDRGAESVRPLVAALVASERYGAPLALGLDRLAGEVRRARRRRAEEAARRVPVKLLFPLVLCTLPAFALLTVAPLVAGALRSLRL